MDAPETGTAEWDVWDGASRPPQCHRMAPAAPPAGPLEYRIYEDALLVPSRSRSAYRNIDGAAFDADLRLIPESLLTRTWRDGQISVAPAIDGLDLTDVETVEPPHIYGGYFFDHFGHFLLESLARAWVIREIGDAPFVWASGGPPNRWQSEVLGLLGVHMPQSFPDRPIRFRRLVVPTPGYRIQGELHSLHARFLACYDDASRLPGLRPRLWLSRTQNHRRGCSPGEMRLQAELGQRGWVIVHPQQHTVAEQLRLLSRASVVAGLEGSAFHAVVLLRHPAAPLITLRRTLNRNYAVIAQCTGTMALDLYGAFRIFSREDLSLLRPQALAVRVDRIATHIERRRGDPAGLAATKRRYERACAWETWLLRQRRQWRAHVHAWARRRLLVPLARRLGRVPGQLRRHVARLSWR